LRWSNCFHWSTNVLFGCDRLVGCCWFRNRMTSFCFGIISSTQSLKPSHCFFSYEDCCSDLVLLISMEHMVHMLVDTSLSFCGDVTEHETFVLKVLWGLQYIWKKSTDTACWVLSFWPSWQLWLKE
jgi:hypothetical protein